MENEILLKIEKIKDVFLNKIKNFDDYQFNKCIIKDGLEEIEKLLKELLNLKDNTIAKNNEELSNLKFHDEKDLTIEIKKESKQNEKQEKNNSKINNNDKKPLINILQNSQNESLLKITNNIINKKNYDYPKLNYNYGNNSYSILNKNNKPISNSNLINTDNNENISIPYLIKNKSEQLLFNNYSSNQKNINNFSNNGYSSLFNFNPDNNINNCSNIINKSSFMNDDSYIKKDNAENINNNINNSKALRVADIMMKINSNDILYNIIIRLYSKDILDQLTSPNVDINLINCLEEVINKVNLLEKEETQKLKIKKNNYLKNRNKNSVNTSINITNNNDEISINQTTISFSEYTNNSQLPSKNVIKRKINEKQAEKFNSEILKKYPKTGKPILGYEKFKKDKNNHIQDFNFKSSLRNENYFKRNKSSINLISKSKSNKSFSGQKKFNPYGSIYGDYFDKSLQCGGQSKLKLNCPTVSNNNKIFKYCRSSVKDYIEGINEFNNI